MASFVSLFQDELLFIIIINNNLLMETSRNIFDLSQIIDVLNHNILNRLIRSYEEAKIERWARCNEIAITFCLDFLAG